MTEHHIVKNIRVGGVCDKDTTIISFNEQAFVFGPEAFDRLFSRLCERKSYLDALRRVEEKTRPRGA